VYGNGPVAVGGGQRGAAVSLSGRRRLSSPGAAKSFRQKRVCVIGAGPCGLTALKNVLQAGCRNVVCYEESSGIGGNWAFTDDPRRASVYECSHTISSRRMSSFDDFPMPVDYLDFRGYAASVSQARRMAWISAGVGRSGRVT
jgi:cation diffusion facilitator CzcD-associated flavoprotein CzcO